MNDLTQRFVKYLKKNTVEVPEKWITKSQLFDVAMRHGYQPDEVKASFRELEELVYIGSIWNGKTRQGEFMYYNMTPEEIQSRIDDNDWFDKL